MRAFLVLIVVLACASTALAQRRPAQTPAQPAAEAAAPGADQYTVMIRQGIDLLMRGDNRGALSALGEALAMTPARPEAQYYIGEAQRVGGNLEEALTAFQSAVTLAMAANEPRWQARALHGVASTLERIEGRLEDARAAWQDYTRFADSHSQVADATIGRARTQAIDMMTEQERVYVEVRARIAAREQERAREEREGAQRRRQPAR